MLLLWKRCSGNASGGGTYYYNYCFYFTSDAVRLRCAGDLRDCLRHIYSALYVELVAKSALHEPGKPFVSEAFVQAVRKWLERCAASST